MSNSATETDKKTAPDTTKAATTAKKTGWKSGKTGPMSKHQSGKPGSFKGEIPDLNGYVYEVHSETAKANQFQKTTLAIAAYMNRTMRNGNDMMNVIHNMEDIDFEPL